MDNNSQFINEQVIQDLKKYYEDIIGLMPGHVYWKNKDFIYLGCNDMQAKSLNLLSRNNIVGKTDYDFSPKEIADEIRKIDLSIINNGDEKSIEETILTNGNKRIVLSKKVPLRDGNNNIVGILGISFDITAEKEAEHLRLEKTVLQEQEAVTRLLAASMAHELRTPLRAIESSVEGISNVLPQLLEGFKMAREAGLEVPFIAPMQFKALNNVIKNTQIETRAAFSVIDMLLVKTNLSHIDMNKFTTCSIARCIEEALARYPLRTEETDIIHWKKCDFSFHGDELLMTHVMFNLLKNALHYIKASEKGDIQIWCEKNDKFNFLHFKDTGLGIAQDILPHVFDRFYTHTRHGTGVGLAFCKLVMQSFGGDITCASVLGEYAEFTLSFPLGCN